MRKGKVYVTSIVLLVMVLIIGGYAYFGKSIEAYAATAIYKGQPHHISFSTALKDTSIEDGTVYVKNEKGEKVDVKISLVKGNKGLVIEGLDVGNYTVSVEKPAFKTKLKFNQARQFEVQVVEQITELTTEKDLKTYFQMIVNSEQSTVTHDGIAEEESEMSNSMTDVASDKSSSGSGRGHSETNNQVDGIEEGDMIITDGDFIYSIVDEKVIITSVKDPASMKVVKKITIGENIQPSHLLLHNDTLIVVYTTYMENNKRGRYYDGKMVTKAAFYDVSNAANPALIREVGHDGSLIGVRKTGNVLYLVSNQTPNYWMLAEGEDVELRPSVYENSSSSVLQLDRIHILPSSQQPNYLIVTAIEVNDVKSGAVKTESFLGNSGTMYMSHNAIYMTAENYMMGRMFELAESSKEIASDASVTSMMMPNANETSIYKVAIDGTSISMAAQSKVKGHILNQFSMDEHNGYFRIATTEGSARGGANADSKNNLFILDKDLKEVGKLTDLARGERIYSARFMDDKAYIVTFKEVDPLFVIDVANPKAPKVLGELKIPGFSNYLHPIGNDHLLGIGYDTAVMMQPGSKEPLVLTQGMKLSLFNVKDLANPIEQDSVIIGGRGTYSDVQYDHKALFRDVANDYYGFPITIYEPKSDENLNYKGTGAQIYKVTPEGIKLAVDLVKPAAAGEMYEDWNNVTQRLLYIDDALYTVSRGEITSYERGTFKQISALKLK